MDWPGQHGAGEALQMEDCAATDLPLLRTVRSMFALTGMHKNNAAVMTAQRLYRKFCVVARS